MLFNVWVTNLCNFQCRYCYVPEYKSNIDTYMADNILKFIADNSLEDEIIVNFHGGEPLLNFKIIKYMVEKLDIILKSRVLYGMTTNGLLLNSEIIEFISRKFIYNLSISLDGTRTTNDLNRIFPDGTGTYDKVIKNFLLLNHLRPDVRVRMTYNPETISELFNSIQHLVNIGFKNIVAIADYTDKNWRDSDVIILKGELEKIFNCYISDSDLDIGFISDLIIRKKNICNGGKTSINIDIDGNLYPCTWVVGYTDFKIGNIHTGIDNEKVRLLHMQSTILNSDCEGCILYQACLGTRCKMINKIITNDFHRSPIFRCQYNNIIYQLQKKYKMI